MIDKEIKCFVCGEPVDLHVGFRRGATRADCSNRKKCGFRLEGIGVDVLRILESAQDTARLDAVIEHLMPEELTKEELSAWGKSSKKSSLYWGCENG